MLIQGEMCFLVHQLSLSSSLLTGSLNSLSANTRRGLYSKLFELVKVIREIKVSNTLFGAVRIKIVLKKCRQTFQADVFSTEPMR